MNKAFFIAAVVAFLAIVAILFYYALTYSQQYYLYSHREELQEKWAQKARSVAEDAMERAKATDEANQKELAASSPLFIDPDGYKTEDNWLASGISREIAGMAYAAVNPDQPLADLKVMAEVDPDKPSVRVNIHGFGIGTDTDIVTDLTPTFVWDPQGYAPLAQKLLGKTVGQPSKNSTDILTRLQDLTGPNLATEDVRLSGNLQQNPASWQDHEAAALALVAMALREKSGYDASDIRTMLNRATAHLALAQALRGTQQETWPGLIADAAIRTLSGRELDAKKALDALSARADCPESAKPWLTALRLVTTEDWRVYTATASSPLLLKIIWFQVVSHNLTSMAATRRLDDLLPPQSNDPAQNAIWNLPDWGRAVLSSPMQLSVENGHRFTENNITLELKEINDVMKVEGRSLLTEDNTGQFFSEDEHDTISKDANGKDVVQVIGPGMFKASSLRHLGMAIRSTYRWMKNLLGLPQDAEAFQFQDELDF